MGKRIGLLVATVAFAALLGCAMVGCSDNGGSAPSGGTAPLRFDGLYCLVGDSDGDGLTDNKVIRFYEEGDVIYGSLEQRDASAPYFPNESWFYRENAGFPGSVGVYTLDGTQISFTVYGANGSVDFWGTVTDGKLILSSHSNINGHDAADREFVFYPFTEIANWAQ